MSADVCCCAGLRAGSACLLRLTVVVAVYNVGGDEEVGAAGLPHVDVGESARMDRQGRLIQSANRGDTAAISAAASAPQTPGLGMVRGKGKRGRNQV